MTGKLPPQVTEFENSLLGRILLEPNLITTISSINKTDHFYNEKNGLIYEAILALYSRNEGIDVLTVYNELKRSGKHKLVDSFDVSNLTSYASRSENIEYHARIIQQNFLLRELIVLGTNTIKEAYEAGADPFEIIDKIQKTTTELTNLISNQTLAVGDYFHKMVGEITEVIDGGLPTGMMTGLKNLDEQTGGWQKGNLIVIGARPGMGKTAIALTFALHPAIELKKAVAIFSMEMTGIELVGRMAASESQINATDINQKKITRLQLQTVGARCHKLIDAPIYIDDTPALKFSQLKNKAKKLKFEKGIELIIIDYLQLMHGDEKGNREQEISYITRNLKALAKELELPIIILSQLSRKCEDRTGPEAKRPQLSDLRESGAIEQDADTVGFIFRPAYYGLFPNGYEYGATTLDTSNLMLFDIAKGRGLKICEVPLKFYGEFMQIRNFNIFDSSDPSPLENNTDFLN